MVQKFRRRRAENIHFAAADVTLGVTDAACGRIVGTARWTASSSDGDALRTRAANTRKARKTRIRRVGWAAGRPDPQVLARLRHNALSLELTRSESTDPAFLWVTLWAFRTILKNEVAFA